MMFGFSYGEIFLLLGATAAVIGPKDLPIIARTAGRLAGRAIGYVQLARGQFETIMQQSQARQVHKELQDTMAQLEAIRHEIRSISVLNPGPMTRRLVDNLDQTPASNANGKPEHVHAGDQPKASYSEVSIEQTDGPRTQTATISKISNLPSSDSCDIHSQAPAYAKLAELSALKAASSQSPADDADLSNVLPVSAESAGLLPKQRDEIRGSDIVLEAVLEAEVAHNAKNFFSQPQNQIKFE